MRYFIVFAYLFAAAINLTPAVGVLSDATLTQLYGIQVESAGLSPGLHLASTQTVEKSQFK